MTSTSARPDGRPLHLVLVADGYPDAAAGAELIDALPLPPGSTITVLGASSAAPRPWQTPDAAAPAGRDGVVVTHTTLPELSAGELRAFTQARRPDLMVVGAAGPVPTLAGKLKEAVNPLVEQLALPVLVARAPFKGLNRILLAYDGSPDSQAAAEYLARLPLPPDSRVRVLYVVTKVPTIEVAPVGGPMAPRLVRSLSDLVVWDEPHARQMHLARSQVAQAVEVLSQAGLAASGQVVWGDAAHAILHKAAATRADLLVAGSRGLSGVWSWLLGSVSRQLVRDGRWPVLIVRSDVGSALVRGSE